MGKDRVVFVGFSSKSGFVGASTKAGLGRLIGVSARTVMRNLEGLGKTGMISVGDEVWWVCETVVSKLDRGRYGKGGGNGVLWQVKNNPSKLSSDTPPGLRGKGSPVGAKIGLGVPAIGFDSVERLDSGKLVSVKRGQEVTQDPFEEARNKALGIIKDKINAKGTSI